MKICWSDIFLLYRRELKSAFRESNIVLYSLLVPMLLYPLMVWLMMSAISFVDGQQQESISKVMIQGLPPEHDKLRGLLESDAHIRLVNDEKPVEALRTGRLDLLAEIIPNRGEPGFVVKLVFDDSKDLSKVARQRFRKELTTYHTLYLEREVQELGMELRALQPFWIEADNRSSSQEVGQYLLGIFLPFTLIVILSIGGLYPAIDSTAGERERNTWETSMTIATPRINLLLAKYLYVSTMASVAGLLNLAAMIVSMRSIIAPLARELADSLSFTISWDSVLVIVIGSVLMAMMIGSGMMLLASFARTFREGQAMVTPIFMLTLLPVSIISDSSVDFTPSMAMVPVLNIGMMWREAIHGVYNWPLIVITLLVQIFCLLVAVWLATRILAYEDMVIGSYGGSFWKFAKDRLFRRNP
ncbi:MAG: ABC transporter permease [Candidatus Eremiobacteraeota bacterium]|nr:ABC transporter permease [Candidatus Eremiobacteraeota bacterium]